MGQYQQWKLGCSVYFYKGAHEHSMLDPRPGSNNLELDFRWFCAVLCVRINHLNYGDTPNHGEQQQESNLRSSDNIIQFTRFA